MRLSDFGGNGGVLNKSRVVFMSLVVAAAGAVTHNYFRRNPNSSVVDREIIIPLIERTESGRSGRVERFSHYVIRQLGFSDAGECPQLRKLIDDFLRKKEGCEESMYAYFGDEKDADSLYVKLLEELETCILSYFAFHWDRAPQMVTQVLSDETEQKPKLKGFVMAATRKQRFERVAKELKVTRVLSTLVEEMKAIGRSSSEVESKCTDVMVPVAHNQRSPVLLLMGGGMGAGKSTVLKDILKEPFWSEAEANAVVVEADAFKETDVLYRAISLQGHHDDMLQSAELVHQSSTDAASSLLVTALNEGRDVIMDGTLSWVPFLEQTIQMARNVHKRRYRMGDGYAVADDGTVTENYWEQVSEEEEEKFEGAEEKENNGGVGSPHRRPYRIELVGVVCDAHLAVIRGIRRAIMVGRAVRVKSQLKSHKRFAEAFPSYCQLVDNARLYCTNVMGSPPKLIGWKNGESKLLIDPEEIKFLSKLSSVNEDADSVENLYPNPSILREEGSIWKEIVMSPSRSTVQQELRASIRSIENSAPKSS